MSEAIHVATRKGLFLLERGKAGWAVERVSFLGDPVSMVLDDARDGRLYAALALGHFGVKLQRSDDRGRTWTEVKAPSFPAEEAAPADAGAGEARKGPSVKQIWSLAAAGERPGSLWAGTISGGLFRSADGGESWQLVRSLWDRPERKGWLGGGYDEPGIHSVCVDAKDPRRVFCGVSTGGVWATRDGGETWELCATGMYAEYMPPEKRDDPNVQDVHRLALSPTSPDVVWAQHHNGVFRTTDGARRWTEVTAIRPSKFGFAVAVHPRDADTAWFVPAVKDERRVPVDGKMAVARTKDGGRSFEVLREGLPQAHAYDLVYRHGLAVDATGERLAMGSTTGSLWTSDDAGSSWRLFSAHLPPVYQVLFSG
jgi:photosystem II stability/assembly factor-like uncharacterized protein